MITMQMISSLAAAAVGMSCECAFVFDSEAKVGYKTAASTPPPNICVGLEPPAHQNGLWRGRGHPEIIIW